MKAGTADDGKEILTGAVAGEQTEELFRRVIEQRNALVAVQDDQRLRNAADDGHGAVAFRKELAHGAPLEFQQTLGHVVELLAQRAQLIVGAHRGFAVQVALAHRFQVLRDFVDGAEQLVGIQLEGMG